MDLRKAAPSHVFSPSRPTSQTKLGTRLTARLAVLVLGHHLYDPGEHEVRGCLEGSQAPAQTRQRRVYQHYMSMNFNDTDDEDSF